MVVILTPIVLMVVGIPGCILAPQNSTYNGHLRGAHGSQPTYRKARDTAVREAVALRRVRHPNVVRFRCLDGGVDHVQMPFEPSKFDQ